MLNTIDVAGKSPLQPIGGQLKTEANSFSFMSSKSDIQNCG